MPPGYQVQPAHLLGARPRAANEFRGAGERVASIARPTDERTSEARAEAGVPPVDRLIAQEMAAVRSLFGVAQYAAQRYTARMQQAREERS